MTKKTVKWDDPFRQFAQAAYDVSTEMLKDADPIAVQAMSMAFAEGQRMSVTFTVDAANAVEIGVDMMDGNDKRTRITTAVTNHIRGAKPCH